MQGVTANGVGIGKRIGMGSRAGSDRDHREQHGKWQGLWGVAGATGSSAGWWRGGWFWSQPSSCSLFLARGVARTGWGCQIQAVWARVVGSGSIAE